MDVTKVASLSKCILIFSPNREELNSAPPPMHSFLKSVFIL